MLVLMTLHDDGRRADHVVGGVIMAMREDVGLSWLLRGLRAGAVPGASAS